MTSELHGKDTAMKMVAVASSPRIEANSTILADTVLERAAERNVETISFSLRHLTYSGCIGCNACKATSDHCIRKDDASAILKSIMEADYIVLASPIYFGDLCGQLKLLFDRFYSFFDKEYCNRLPKGKRVLLVFSQGMPEEDEYRDTGERYEYWLKMIGFESVTSFFGGGLNEAGDVLDRPELLDKIAKVTDLLLRA